MQDTVAVEGLELAAEVGVYAHERGVKQRLVVDVRCAVDLEAAARSDQLEDALDYDRIAGICRDVAAERHHQLIEAIAGKIADRVRREFGSRVGGVEVRVAKPGAVPDAATVAVEVRR